MSSEKSWALPGAVLPIRSIRFLVSVITLVLSVNLFFLPE